MPGLVKRMIPVNAISGRQAILLLLVFTVFFCLPFFPALFTDDRYYGLSSNRQAPDFRLANLSGERIALSDFSGEYVFLMFGYLNCDGLCHNQVMLFHEINALARVSKVRPPRFVYVMMDPDRDDTKKVAQYFDAHADNFISLNAADFKQAQTVAMDYGAFFSKEGRLSSGDYRLNHPGRIFLIDPAGKQRFTYSANHRQADRIMSDLSLLQAEQQKITLPGV